MRFVHIGDLHLGKLLFQQNLLETQADLLAQVVDYMVNQEIDVLVMAGDIYDRSVPSNEAVGVLSDFLSTLILKHHKKVLMISGNHDSATRLGFASELLKQEGLYIETYPKQEMKPVTIDGVNFYLLPFFKPSYIRYLYQEDQLTTYQEAFKYYLAKQELDLSKPSVLVTHQFIAGNKAIIKSESEAILSVGGSEIIDVDLVKPFDYVALGHLHASQKVSCETIRYSGSLMRYSFDEVNQKKSIVDVTINGHDVTYQLVELQPKQNLLKLSDTFERLMSQQYPSNNNDFIAIELLDTTIIPNAIDYLRTKFNLVLQITYPKLNSDTNNGNTKADFGFEKLSPIELYEQFYFKIKNEPLSEAACDIVKEILKGGNEDVTQ